MEDQIRYGKIERFIVPCSICGTIVERVRKWAKVCCLDCKMKRIARANKLRIYKPRPKRIKKMRPLSPETKKELLADPLIKVCCLKDDTCKGVITFHHAIIYRGRQLDEAWSILSLCEWHHSVGKYQDNGIFNQEKAERIALNRASLKRLMELSKAINYHQRKVYLNRKYGDK